MNPSNKSLAITIIVLAVAVLAGIGSYRIWGIRWWEYLRRAPSEESQEVKIPSAEIEKEKTASEEEAARVTPPPASVRRGAGEYSLTVLNQPAGMRVTISSVTASSNVWAVVHQDENGRPGKILGAERFRLGRTQGAVDLLRGTVSGGAYYVLLHSDDGNSEFMADKDLPVEDAAGETVLVKFNAQ